MAGMKTRHPSGSGSTSFDGERAIKSVPAIGQNLGTATVAEFLEAAFFAFVQAVISINSGTTYYEIGTSQNVTISGTVTANDEDTFSNARIDCSVGDDIAFTAQAGAYSATDSAVTADVDYIAKIDVGGDGTPGTISSATKYVRFIYPILHGMTSEVLTGSDLYANTTKLIQTKGNKSVLLDGSNEFIYFAYPSSYGNLTQIKDQNGFDVTDSFQSETVTVTGLQGGLSASYKVYRTIATTTVDSASFTFYF